MFLELVVVAVFEMIHVVVVSQGFVMGVVGGRVVVSDVPLEEGKVMVSDVFVEEGKVVVSDVSMEEGKVVMLDLLLWGEERWCEVMLVLLVL